MVPVTERQCPFWSAGWGRCSPGKGLKEGTALWQVPGVYSREDGVETKVGVKRASPFLPRLRVDTRPPPEGTGTEGVVSGRPVS